MFQRRRRGQHIALGVGDRRLRPQILRVGDFVDMGSAMTFFAVLSPLMIWLTSES